MSTSASDTFDSVVLFALKKLDLTGVCLKWIAVRQFSTERIHSCAFATGYGKSLCYQIIPFFKDFKLGCSGYCTICFMQITHMYSASSFL